jgi:biopolymer transport protein ExbB
MAAAAASTQLAPEAVMARISEALVATAIGILIAIPAVAAYNAFQRVVRGTVANTEALGHMLLSHLKAIPCATGSSAAAAASTVERISGGAKAAAHTAGESGRN